MKAGRILIVSGIPRSGTSMMMKMLEAAGIPILSDTLRGADDDNPNGYFEYERVKKLSDGDNAWLKKGQGKAIKIIYSLLKYLPSAYDYDVIFMRRDLSEVLASQRRMLERRKKETDLISDEDLARLFTKESESAISWINQQSNFRIIEMNYSSLIFETESQLEKLRVFLEIESIPVAMAAVIDRKLYRQRVKSSDMQKLDD